MTLPPAELHREQSVVTALGTTGSVPVGRGDLGRERKNSLEIHSGAKGKSNTCFKTFPTCKAFACLCRSDLNLNLK